MSDLMQVFMQLSQMRAQAQSRAHALASMQRETESHQVAMDDANERLNNMHMANALDETFAKSVVDAQEKPDNILVQENLYNKYMDQVSDGTQPTLGGIWKAEDLVRNFYKTTAYAQVATARSLPPTNNPQAAALIKRVLDADITARWQQHSNMLLVPDYLNNDETGKPRLVKGTDAIQEAGNPMTDPKRAAMWVKQMGEVDGNAFLARLDPKQADIIRGSMGSLMAEHEQQVAVNNTVPSELDTVGVRFKKMMMREVLNPTDLSQDNRKAYAYSIAKAGEFKVPFVRTQINPDGSFGPTSEEMLDETDIKFGVLNAIARADGKSDKIKDQLWDQLNPSERDAAIKMYDALPGDARQKSQLLQTRERIQRKQDYAVRKTGDLTRSAESINMKSEFVDIFPTDPKTKKPDTTKPAIGKGLSSSFDPLSTWAEAETMMGESPTDVDERRVKNDILAYAKLIETSGRKTTFEGMNQLDTTNPQQKVFDTGTILAKKWLEFADDPKTGILAIRKAKLAQQVADPHDASGAPKPIKPLPKPDLTSADILVKNYSDLADPGQQEEFLRRLSAVAANPATSSERREVLYKAIEQIVPDYVPPAGGNVDEDWNLLFAPAGFGAGAAITKTGSSASAFIAKNLAQAGRVKTGAIAGGATDIAINVGGGLAADKAAKMIGANDQEMAVFRMAGGLGAISARLGPSLYKKAAAEWKTLRDTWKTNAPEVQNTLSTVMKLDPADRIAWLTEFEKVQPRELVTLVKDALNSKLLSGL